MLLHFLLPNCTSTASLLGHSRSICIKNPSATLAWPRHSVIQSCTWWSPCWAAGTQVSLNTDIWHWHSTSLALITTRVCNSVVSRLLLHLGIQAKGLCTAPHHSP